MPNNISSNGSKKVCYPFSCPNTNDASGSNIYNMRRLIDARHSYENLYLDPNGFLGQCGQRPASVKMQVSWCEWINLFKMYQLDKEAMILETDYLELMRIVSGLVGADQVYNNRPLQKEITGLQADFRRMFESTVIPPNPGAREAFAQRLDDLLARVREVQEHYMEHQTRLARNYNSQQLSGPPPMLAETRPDSPFAPPENQNGIPDATGLLDNQAPPQLRRRHNALPIDPPQLPIVQFPPEEAPAAIELTPEQQDGVRRAIDPAIKYRAGDGGVSPAEELRLRANLAEAMGIDGKLHPLRSYQKGSLNYGKNNIQAIVQNVMTLMSSAQRAGLGQFLQQAYPEVFNENLLR